MLQFFNWFLVGLLIRGFDCCYPVEQEVFRMTADKGEIKECRIYWPPLTLIGKFSGYELERFMENSSNSQFQNFGAWHGPIHEKLIQNRANSRKIIFDESRGVTQTDIVQKLNKYSRKIAGWIFQKSVQLMSWQLKFRNILDEFSRNCVTPNRHVTNIGVTMIEVWWKFLLKYSPE